MATDIKKHDIVILSLQIPSISSFFVFLCEMEKKVQAFILQENLPLAPAKIIVGLSGGADSVALVHILQRLGYSCVLAHCNFHLRGAESDRDEAFTQNLAVKLGLQYFKTDFDTQQYAKSNGLSIEMAARELRYAWFETLRIELGASAIAVAHHADDVVETFMMNLTRGTGIHGLTGIKPRNGNLIRPLLCLSQAEVHAYITEHALSYVTDSSNLEEEYTRNKFRHSVIPLMESINPSFKTTILQTIERLASVESIYNNSVASLKNIYLSESAGLVTILLSKDMNPAFDSFLYETLTDYGFTVDVITKCISAKVGALFFSPNYQLVKDRECLIISPKQDKQLKSFAINKEDKDLSSPFCLQMEFLSKEECKIVKNPTHAYLDADKLQFPLIIRAWEAGDSFLPFGMKGRKKVSDYLIDNKYSITKKQQVMVLESAGDIVWLVGERIHANYAISDQTAMVYHLHLS